MVSVSQLLLREFRQEDSDVNVLDLKAYYRGHKYVTEMIKLLPEKPDPILMDEIFDRISQLGRVHLPQLSLNKYLSINNRAFYSCENAQKQSLGYLPPNLAKVL